MAILGQEPVTLTRYTAGARGAAGRFVPGAATTSTIQASIQPITGRDLKFIPEGLRQSVSSKAYTETALLTADQATGILADRLTIDGDSYMVVTLAPQRSVIAHTRAYLVRIAETGGEA